MKGWKIIILGILIIIIPNIGLSAFKTIDRIVAIVGKEVILDSDINILIDFLKFNVEQNIRQLLKKDISRHQILEYLILDQIMLQINKKMRIKISDEQLDLAINNIAKQLNISIKQMNDYLNQYGINYFIYRNQIYKKMLISEIYSNEVSRRVVVLPQEIEASLNEINCQNNDSTELNLSYIFISLPKNLNHKQEEEVENQAKKIAEQIHKGISFDKLKINFLVKRNYKLSRGEIGWSSIRELPSVFSKELRKVKKGDIVGCIRSEHGLFILKVNDVRFLDDQNTDIIEAHVNHILLKKLPLATENQTQAKLKLIASDIKNNKISFAIAAKKFSHDSYSARNGGDLGWITLDAYGPILYNTIMNLNKNQISEPVRSFLGWHLIKILDIRKINNISSIKKNRAYRTLFNNKFNKEAKLWLQEQRANIYIKVLND